jgi:hypothetical protein
MQFVSFAAHCGPCSLMKCSITYNFTCHPIKKSITETTLKLFIIIIMKK